VTTRELYIHRYPDDPEPCSGYVAVLTLPTDILVEVVVYEVVGRSVPDGALLFLQKGWTSSMDHVTSMADAEVWLRGDIKWDGCSHWSFDNGGVMLHFCDPEDAAFVGEVWRRVYDAAREMLGPKADWPASTARMR